jgi:hypothetical protein
MSAGLGVLVAYHRYDNEDFVLYTKHLPQSSPDRYISARKILSQHHTFPINYSYVSSRP